MEAKTICRPRVYEKAGSHAQRMEMWPHGRDCPTLSGRISFHVPLDLPARIQAINHASNNIVDDYPTGTGANKIDISAVDKACLLRRHPRAALWLLRQLQSQLRSLCRMGSNSPRCEKQMSWSHPQWTPAQTPGDQHRSMRRAPVLGHLLQAPDGLYPQSNLMVFLHGAGWDIGRFYHLDVIIQCWQLQRKAAAEVPLRAAAGCASCELRAMRLHATPQHFKMRTLQSKADAQ